MLRLIKKIIESRRTQSQNVGDNSTALQVGDNAQITLYEVNNDSLDFQQELSIASLIGHWDEKNKGDISIIEFLANEDYSSWIKKIRAIEGGKNNFLIHNSGIWSFKDRLKTWNSVACRLFDDHLIKFKDISINTLGEIDPKFELEPEERYAAAIHGKIFPHSSSIRKGISEGLAIISTHHAELINCSNKFGDFIAREVIREIFTNSNWKLWASTQDVQPILAEAAPDEFLDAIEIAVVHHDKPFDILFSQEGVGGITGTNYMTGLLWALERLAWSPDYLTRCIVLLGEMDSHDPGGNWTNRPKNSIVDILLPWLPHTTANFDRRYTSLKALEREFPETAWKVSLNLLPSSHGTTSGTNTPEWRAFIPEDFKKEVTQKEYLEQVVEYSNYVVTLSKKDNSRLLKIIQYLDHLHDEAFDAAVKALLDYSSLTSSPEDRYIFWIEILNFTNKHKKYSDADWSLSSEKIDRLNPILTNLKPEDKLFLYRRLFSHSTIDLFEDKGNWREQEEIIIKERDKAVSELFTEGGYESIYQFSQAVESSDIVGNSFGKIFELDKELLKEYLKSDDLKTKQYISGYIWTRNYVTNGQFIENIKLTSWDSIDSFNLLLLLPFNPKTWDKVDDILGLEFEYLYWSNVNVKSYHCDDKDDLYRGIDFLLKYDRPLASIHCIYSLLREKKILRLEPTVKALLGAVNSKESPTNMDSYEIGEIIKFLQVSEELADDDRFRIEWAYLPLISRGHDQSSSPQYLDRRLTKEPGFFCEIIRLTYRSDTADPEAVVNKSQRNIARNASELLDKWGKVPGYHDDGSFDPIEFESWLSSVVKISKESGHLRPALRIIGKNLINSPKGDDGTWIHITLAEFLNRREFDYVRDAYKIAVYNSRGVHTIDPEAKPEIKLAEIYQSKSEDMELLGYQRFARTLREISEHYSFEAQGIIKREGKLII
ncbi:hypothetical protein F0259_05575 [Vibrio cyclitrophicus]|uniref:hypothetical protein n=1 Tax=Vibrio cyclitrophicus TaxID=47951 RepID=UPI00148C77BB|nr:hypothetical protein [Vibrio cyclitrophicus]NOH43292.1 hypothetical protein [Vibrio cyclitrophicus]